MLSVPQAALVQEGTTGTTFSSGKPITLVCGPVTFPGGAPLTTDNAETAGFVLYREAPAGARSVWDEDAKSWLPETASPPPQPLMYQAPNWQGILVATGPNDAAGMPKFESAGPSGLPRYFARCRFAGRDASQELHRADSGPTQSIALAGASDDDRVGALIDPDTKAATELRLFLKDAGLTERARLAIRAVTGGYEIELSTPAATALLAADGAILLSPAPGHNVKISGGLDVKGPITVNGTTLDVP
jgi:hypothetical protein